MEKPLGITAQGMRICCNPHSGECLIPDAKWHGTSGGYSNHRCKCADCKKAWSITIAKIKANRAAKKVAA